MKFKKNTKKRVVCITIFNLFPTHDSLQVSTTNKILVSKNKDEISDNMVSSHVAGAKSFL